jgi:hypothetical protein
MMLFTVRTHGQAVNHPYAVGTVVYPASQSDSADVQQR